MVAIAPFDSLEMSFLEERRDLDPRLFARRPSGTDRTQMHTVPPEVHLLSLEQEQLFADSLGVAWERLRFEFGREATTLAFAEPVVAKSGDQALVYYVRSELYAMGASAAYAFLERRNGTWTVAWREGVYIE